MNDGFGEYRSQGDKCDCCLVADGCSENMEERVDLVEAERLPEVVDYLEYKTVDSDMPYGAYLQGVVEDGQISRQVAIILERNWLDWVEREKAAQVWVNNALHSVGDSVIWRGSWGRG